MKTLYLTTLFAAIALAANAQYNPPVDSFITKSGAVYKGTLIEKHPGYFTFRTETNSELTVPDSSVVSSYFYVASPNQTSQRQVRPQRPYSMYQATYGPRRNTGIVLTVLGLGAFSGGVALIATNPQDRQNYSTPTGAGVNFRGSAAGGFIMVLLSPALFITGSVIWAKASQKLQQERLQKKTPKDL